MSEATRRLGYARNRILIESARILDPQFDDAIVHLSGAQIELLRNVAHYLNRPSSYVAEYESGSYLMPTDEDWDTLAGIVHDLEEKLMGNQNVIWGYYERWVDDAEITADGDGPAYVVTALVPAGYVYVLEQWEVWHQADATMSCYAAVYQGPDVVQLWDAPALPHNDHEYQSCRVTLSEGDRFLFKVLILPDTKTAYARVWGYKMKVPE